MKLILDLFQRIFIALQGVYTKTETDSALATKADATALTEETQAREDADWRSYMLARARLTGVAANVSKVQEVILLSVAEGDSGVLPARMIEDWKNLYTYETWLSSEGLSSPLDSAFWSAYFVALAKFEKNPTETTRWTVTKSGDTYSSNCPYFGAPQNEPVIDFAVVSAKGLYPTAVLNRAGSAIYYLPNLTEADTFNYISMGNNTFILPNLEHGQYFAWGAKTYNAPLYAPRLKDGKNALLDCVAFASPVTSLSIVIADTFFNKSAVNRVFDLRSLSMGQSLFKNSKMSAENISATLDSLPNWKDGASHVITFTGCPGAASTATTETFTVTDDDGTEYSLDNCPVFTTDDEAQTLRKSYVLAVAKKGWTVEI